MFELGIGCGSNQPSTVLFLGAHCDDIEIGCGATILALRRMFPSITCHWMTFCSDDVRRREALASAQLFLGSDDNVSVESFRDGFLPYTGAKVKDRFEALKREIQPDIVFTHYRDDRHQDHRLVCELTWNTFRNNLIFEYEIPKWDGDLGSPNVFICASSEDLKRKSQYLLDAYSSQRTRQWFDDDTIRGLARLRGIEANAPERFAEAFYCRKAVLAVAT